MDRSVRRLVLASLVVYILAAAFFLGLAVREFPPGDVLAVFSRQWVIATAFYRLIEYLIPLQVFAIIVTFSLLLGGHRTGGAAPFFELVRPVLVVVLLSAVVYTLLVGLVQPGLARSRAEAEYRSDLAESLLNRGDQAYDAEEYVRAATEYETYLAINPDDREVEARFDEARREAARSRAAARQDEAAAEPSPAEARADGRTASELVDEAREALAAEDYLTAHYLARLALELDPGRPNARDIVADANRRMSSLELSNLEESDRAIYVRKREAYEAWQNDQIFRAYRIFSELAEERPNDRDVRRYLPRVEEDLRRVAFFSDEIGRAIHRPGSTDVMFVTASPGGRAARRFVSIERLVSAPEGTYAQNIEVADVAADGEVLRHMQAPYGKLRANRFVVQVVEPGTDEVVYGPSYLVRPAEEDPLPTVPVPYGARELHALRETGPLFASVGVGDLLMMNEFFPELGYGVDGVQLAIAMKLVLPFSFVILSFFAVAAGWAWRSRYIARAPLPILVLLPVVPFVLSLFTTFYLYLQRIVIGALLPVSGFTVVLIITVVIQAVLLLFSLVVLAGQSTS